MLIASKVTRTVIIALSLGFILPASAFARPPHPHGRAGITDGYVGHDAVAAQAGLLRSMQGLRHGWPSGNYTPRTQI
jgi:hypothetical protein